MEKQMFSICSWLWDTLENDLATDQWSSAGCWPRFNEMLPQLIDIPHALINMSLTPCVSFSQCLQALVHWRGFHAAREGWKWTVQQ